MVEGSTSRASRSGACNRQYDKGLSGHISEKKHYVSFAARVVPNKRVESDHKGTEPQEPKRQAGTYAAPVGKTPARQFGTFPFRKSKSRKSKSHGSKSHGGISHGS